MNKLVLLILIIFSISSCEKDGSITTETENKPVIITQQMHLPSPDHMIFVWFENHGYSQIIGDTVSAPYINSLISEGTLFNNFHALGHPSYPEYLRFFAGTNNDKIDDDCINGAPFINSNLYTQLKERGKSFAWYSEDLPVIGSDVCYSGQYVERHNPTQCFANVPSAANRRWIDFPTDYSLLETVVCISPNLDNDMHNGSIKKGDDWLKRHCENLINWCKIHNSVFVIYFDEDNGTTDNRIPVIILGEPVKSNYTSAVYYDHYNWTRTILNLNKAEQIANSKFRQTITDCWK